MCVCVCVCVCVCGEGGGGGAASQITLPHNKSPIFVLLCILCFRRQPSGFLCFLTMNSLRPALHFYWNCCCKQCCVVCGWKDISITVNIVMVKSSMHSKAHLFNRKSKSPYVKFTTALAIRECANTILKYLV